MALGGGVLVLLIILLAANLFKQGQVPATQPVPAAAPEFARERVSKLDQVKLAADQNPERIAELLKKWLSE